MKTRKVKIIANLPVISILTTVFFSLTSATISAQTTAFNFQGRLNDGANPANGNVEVQFKLYDSLTGGTQIGATVARPNVVVINGIFTTQLDFGATAFDGSNRFVEIGVRPSGSTGGVTTLNPRQAILSTPYAIQAKNAAQLGGIPASEYVTTTSVGNSFIKNAATQQTGNFNISGSGNDSFGIGVTPNAAYKLDVNGQANFRTGGIAGGGIVFGTPNGETGFTINGTNTNRADLRFDGSTMKLIVGQGNVGPPPETNGIIINALGNVGIGITPNTIDKLIAVAVGSNRGVTGISTSGEGINGSSTSGVGVKGFSQSGIGLVGTSGDRNNFGVFSFGYLGVDQLGGGGTTALCRNTSNQVSTCSSSLRYKTNIASFGYGLNVVKQLRPISFDWKEGGMKDVGFGAEDVAKINPLFVIYNEKGEVEGVKYDRLSVVFVNALNEQQTQIEQQRRQIEDLKKLICLEHPTAALCQEK